MKGFPLSGGFYYLASPYTHPTKKGMHERYLEALHATAGLLQGKTWVYSPILHCHEIARLHDMPTDFKFWLDYNHSMIDASSGILVLCCDGWDKSKGVAEEMEYASTTGKLVLFLVKDKAGEYTISTVPPLIEAKQEA